MKKHMFPDELIGEEVKVVESRNKSNLGLTGKIVDETKSTLTIQSEGQTKMIMKNNVTIELTNGQVIKGTNLSKRPDERIKG
jgi:ribonuclease P protein subunit POP4